MKVIIILIVALLHHVDSFSFMEEQENLQQPYIFTFILNNNNNTNLTIYLFPETMYGIKEKFTQSIAYDYTLSYPQPIAGKFFVEDTNILKLSALGNVTFRTKWKLDNPQLNNSQDFTHSLNVTGIFLGRTKLQLNLTLLNASSNSYYETNSGFRYDISVVRKLRIIDFVFQGCIWVFILMANTGMGMEIKMKVIKEVLKKPVAPILGFVSQFIFMPLISFGVLQILPFPPSTALGYFGMGCAPGGGASNFYCLLLGGDVSLSITMTLISTIGALGIIPLYMFTLGQYILDQNKINIQIPYLNICLTLLLILIPSVLGYAIKCKLPRVAKIYRKLLKPMVLIFIIFMFTFGIYANLFIWKLFSPVMIAAGCILPYAGFFLGAILSAIFRQSWARVKTISIETGIQNPGVPILILRTSLPQPDADLSLVGPIAAATFTPLPLMLWVLVRLIYRKCFKKDEDDKGSEEASDQLEVEEKMLEDFPKDR